MFGFGSGFPTPLFSEERGLSFEDRYERMEESLALIKKCWSNEEPFDWNGKFWQGKNITIIPKPLQGADLPFATATFTPASVEMAGRLGIILLALGAPDSVRATGDRYAAAGRAAGHDDPLRKFTVARFIYVADSVEQAANDIRPAVELEMGYQRARGLFASAIASYKLQKDPDAIRFDDLAEAGVYLIGDPDTVYQKLLHFYEQSGGFGTLLYIVGKEWATREKRAASMRRFMQEVAPRLRVLTTAGQPILS
jgi:alkanesulfonate monooxygenase SsuD/methylene tetrahydromethanopterin reductase-like flavin-dependent oxidoreductase (luciferase family)